MPGNDEERIMQCSDHTIATVSTVGLLRGVALSKLHRATPLNSPTVLSACLRRAAESPQTQMEQLVVLSLPLPSNLLAVDKSSNL